MRKTLYKRKTKETDIEVALAMRGSGTAKVATGIAFFDHMLETFALHSGIDLTVKLKGDLEVDMHHSVEDLGICLGNAIKNALGEKKGINRAGFFIFPMDEALATVAIDLSGRPFLDLQCPFAQAETGCFSTDLVHDFLWALAFSLPATLHVRVEKGRSAHHQVEAIFKALARAFKHACQVDAGSGGKIPSTKGAL